MILLRHLDYFIPREGAGSILSIMDKLICGGATPDVFSMFLGVYLNDLIPTETTTLADLTIDDASLGVIGLNGGGTCTDNIEGPSLNPDEWAFIFDQQTFTLGADPGPTTVYGAFIGWDSEGGDADPDQLVGIRRFDAPIVLATVGDILKLTGSLPLLPQMG